jgi:hypothetical protein
MTDHENQYMHHLFHHNCGYAYVVVLSYCSWVILFKNRLLQLLLSFHGKESVKHIIDYVSTSLKPFVTLLHPHIPQSLTWNVFINVQLPFSHHFSWWLLWDSIYKCISIKNPILPYFSLRPWLTYWCPHP